MGKEDFVVEYEEGLVHPVDDFEGKIRSTEEFEVQVNHHIHTQSQNSLDFGESFLFDVLQQLSVQFRVVFGVAQH